MIISEQHRFIFVHIPKSGGTSCAAALKAALGLKERRHWAMPGTSKHVTLGQVKACMERPPWRPFSKRLRFEDYFKFAFVRNPWSRIVSLFHYLTETAIVPETRGLATFDDFIRAMSVGTAWIDRLHSTKLQLSYLEDEHGRLVADFVGRYETLADDFRAACARIGVRAELPHLNQSASGRQPRPYQDHYTPETRELVRQRFLADIEHFGYTFAGEASRRAA